MTGFVNPCSIGKLLAPWATASANFFASRPGANLTAAVIGVVIDGCPPRIEISEADIQRELDRRRPGQSSIVTQRDEPDRCQILSGVFEGKTLGTPISILVMNKDARPEAYREMAQTFRPSHADFTYEAKYGIRNWQGGGRASARETIGRVAAGAIARKVLQKISAPFEVVAYVAQVHEISAEVDRDDGEARGCGEETPCVVRTKRRRNK